jgi:hypothetical protein
VPHPRYRLPWPGPSQTGPEPAGFVQEGQDRRKQGKTVNKQRHGCRPSCQRPLICPPSSAEPVLKLEDPLLKIDPSPKAMEVSFSCPSGPSLGCRSSFKIVASNLFASVRRGWTASLGNHPSRSGNKVVVGMKRSHLPPYLPPAHSLATHKGTPEYDQGSTSVHTRLDVWPRTGSPPHGAANLLVAHDPNASPPVHSK